MIEPRRNILLSELTTMRVGGLARFFVEVETMQELKEAIAFAKEQGMPFMIMGGGSNLVFGDAGFPGLVIRLQNRRYSMSSGNHELVSGAAVTMEELVTQSTEKGWAGLEWAGGLPGTVGGAVRGNAGCFGGEIKDVVMSVTVLDPATGQASVVYNEDCGFGYRTSAFKTNGQIVWEVRMRLAAGDRAELTQIRDEKIAYRTSHHPQAPSAGSIFQNLYVHDLPDDIFVRFPELQQKVRGEKIGAGALLDRLGMRGTKRGGAMISKEHANIVVNTGSARAADVRALVLVMQEAVRAEYGIILHEEPEFVSLERDEQSPRNNQQVSK